MGISVNFEGVYKKLKAMDELSRKEIIGEVLHEAAQPILERLQDNVPFKTGELRDSLGIKKQIEGKGSYYLKIGVGYGGKIGTGRLQAIQDKAYYTNYGTRKLAGRHWKRISLEEAEDEVHRRFAEAIKKRLG